MSQLSRPLGDHHVAVTDFDEPLKELEAAVGEIRTFGAAVRERLAQITERGWQSDE
ncbi:MAG: hypothetical protein R8G34_07900 [Paracoccaceae bacterium]|nr:hypothetical protein [Paracoccaceae bacterium]